MRCDACRFWTEVITRDNDDALLHKDDYWADCRRFPPVRWAKPGEFNGPDAFEFPSTAANQWCGEFQPTTGL